MRIINLEALISKYFEFKKDAKKLKNFLDKQAKELNKDRASDSVPDDKRKEIPKSKWCTWLRVWRGKKKNNHKEEGENDNENIWVII